MKRTTISLFAACVALVGCEDALGIGLQDLQGTWEATTYRYAENAAPSNTVDIIQRDGASFTLTVDAEGTASTLFDDGLGGSSSDSGTLDGTQTTLTLAGSTFRALRNGDVLTLTDVSAEFDFGSGSTPATLVVVMSRQ